MSDEPLVNPRRSLGSSPMSSLLLALPAWLERQRWFADKGREIAAVAWEDTLIEDVEDDVLILAIVRVSFAAGSDERYFLPLACTNAPIGPTITHGAAGPSTGAFVEATSTAWFGRWLIEAMLAETTRPENSWQFGSQPQAREVLTVARLEAPHMMGVEQSNTSLRIGAAAIVKLVRRLQPGPNPDEELLRALAAAGFARVPRYLGSASWGTVDRMQFPIVLAQAFVANQGDGWSWLLNRLRTPSDSEAPSDSGLEAAEYLLGRRTGELHAALASMSGPDLNAAPVTHAEVGAEQERIRRSVSETIDLLKKQGQSLPAPLQEMMPGILTGLGAATSLADGLAAETDLWHIRVHGDYHLGQTLRTLDNDWVIIDFEGEPARPASERRQKTSALKDVAGMLRSFAYARGAAERAGGVDAARLGDWERAARLAFLAGYREAVGTAVIPLVPEDDSAFAAALAAWELDKALYEVAYEVRNRPDWVELPLRRFLPAV